MPVYLPTSLIDVKDSPRLVIRRYPCVRGLARQKYALSSSSVELLVACDEHQVAINHVNPFILCSEEAARAETWSRELEDTHRAAGSKPEALQSIGWLARFTSSPNRASPEATVKPANSSVLIFFAPPYMLDRLVDGCDQDLGAGESLFQHGSTRFERGGLLEIGSTKDVFDFLELETKLPVEQDLKPIAFGLDD